MLILCLIVFCLYAFSHDASGRINTKGRGSRGGVELNTTSSLCFSPPAVYPRPFLFPLVGDVREVTSSRLKMAVTKLLRGAEQIDVESGSRLRPARWNQCCFHSSAQQPAITEEQRLSLTGMKVSGIALNTSVVSCFGGLPVTVRVSP